MPFAGASRTVRTASCLSHHHRVLIRLTFTVNISITVATITKWYEAFLFSSTHSTHEYCVFYSRTLCIIILLSYIYITCVNMCDRDTYFIVHMYICCFHFVLENHHTIIYAHFTCHIINFLQGKSINVGYRRNVKYNK